MSDTAPALAGTGIDEATSAAYWRQQAQAANRRVTALERRVESLNQHLDAAKFALKQFSLPPRDPKPESASRAHINANMVRRQRDMLLNALGCKGYRAALERIQELLAKQATKAPAPPKAEAQAIANIPRDKAGYPCGFCAYSTPDARTAGGFSCRRSAFACKPLYQATSFTAKDPNPWAFTAKESNP